MGENSQVKKSGKAAAAATRTVQTGQQDYLNSPEYAQVQALIGQVMANPLTMTPEAQETMYRSGVSQANAGANQFLNERMTQLEGYGGAGYRSGAAREAEYETGARLGEGLAQAYRQTQLAMAQQRVPDLLNAANAGTSLLNNEFGLSQSVANAQLGQAGVLSQLAGVPSPAQQIGGGAGGILGNILTAGTSSKGIFKGS